MADADAGLRAQIEQVIAQWRRDADDARDRGYDEAWCQQHSDATALEQLLAGAQMEPEAGKMADAIEKYAEWCGGVHDDDCPQDDTCDCSGKWINDGITAAINYLRGRASGLFDEMCAAMGAQPSPTCACGHMPSDHCNGAVRQGCIHCGCREFRTRRTA